MINSSSRRLSSNNAPPSRWLTRTRLIPLTAAVLSIVWAISLLVSTGPAAETVNAQPNQQNQSPTATSTPPTATPTPTPPTDCPWDTHIGAYLCSDPPTPTPPSATPTPPSCSFSDIGLSRSYRSGSWTSSDCYSIRRSGGVKYVDYYTFTLTETTPVRIDLESLHDTYLYLIRGADPRGSTSSLEFDDDGGDGRNSRIQRTLNPGLIHHRRHHLLLFR